MWETCGPDVARIVQISNILYMIKMLLAVQPSIMRITKDSDRNSTGTVNLFIKQFHVIPQFEIASLSTLNNPFLFHNKCRERQVKVFIQDRLLIPKTAIMEKIGKNKFPLLKLGSAKSTCINLEVPFMNKLRSAVEHQPVRANELYKEELYGVSHCFPVDCIDEMCHGTKSLIQERLLSCQQPIMSETYRNAIIVEASPILRKLSNVSADDFNEFAFVFYIYVICLAEGFGRLDLVFDCYLIQSV